MLRKFVLGILIIISYLLQTTFKSQISIGNITPNLLLIMVCIFALLRGKKEGMYIGFFAGLILDLYFGYSGVVGFNALIYMYVGYATGIFQQYIYIDDIMIPVSFTAAASLLTNAVFFVIAFLLRNRLDFGTYFLKIMLPEMIYTIFLTVFLYLLYRFINNLLEKHEKQVEAKNGKGNIGSTV